MNRLFLATVLALTLGCNQVLRDYDPQMEHHTAISAVADQLVDRRVIASGDLVAIAGYFDHGADRAPAAYDDALVAGLTRRGVRVVRLSGSGLHDKVNAGALAAETEQLALLQALREKSGVSRLVVYHWLQSRDRHTDDSRPYAYERVYVRLIDSKTGVTTWSDLLEATSLKAAPAQPAPRPTDLGAPAPVVAPSAPPSTTSDRLPLVVGIAAGVLVLVTVIAVALSGGARRSG